MQDTMTYNSKQQQGSVDVTIGYGFSGSASYSQSKINADYASVNEQSGIFAGEDGYQINVKNHTDLKGGIITSTQNAENNGKNRFETGTLSFEDLANKAEYKGEAIGLGVSGSVKGENSKNPNSVVADKTGMSNTMGYGRESDKQYATTHSGINTANIIIRDNEKQQQITGMSAEEIKQAVKTDITTDNYAEHSGSLKNVFDAEKVQNKIDLQVKVTKEFRSNVQDFQAKQNKRLDELKEKKERGEISEQEYEEQAKKIELQKLITNVVAGGLLAPSDSVLGVATSTLAPAASYQVGQYFKEQGKEGSFEHIATHAVLGALTYAANGTNALTGAISAGGAEAATPIVAKVLYGKDNSQNLTADEKETVVAVTTAIGTLSGSIVGDSSANAYIGNTVAGNAVANNWLTAEQNIRKKEIEQLLRQKLQLADLILGGDIDRTKINALMKELRALEKESADNDRQLEAAINSCIDYLSCDTLKKIHWDLRRELSEKGWAKFEQDRKNGNIEKNWEKLSDTKAAYHNYVFDKNGNIVENKDANGNYYYEKWVDKATGQYEVILDRRTSKTVYNMKMITDNTNGGTFNFYSPNGLSGIDHRTYDMLPWGLVGSGPDDKTTYSIRTGDNWGWLSKYFTIPSSRIEQINNKMRNPTILLYR